MTYPVRNVYQTFVCYELKHTTVRMLPVMLVRHLEQHWVADVQSCQLLEGRLGHNDLTTVGHVFTEIPVREGDRMAPVLFAELVLQPGNAVETEDRAERAAESKHSTPSLRMRQSFETENFRTLISHRTIIKTNSQQFGLVPYHKN